MNKLGIMTVVLAVSLGFGGCLSVIRLPCEKDVMYSDEGEVTNRVWTTFRQDLAKNPHLRGLYPTVKMRWYCTKQVYFNDKFYFDEHGEPLKGEKLYRAKMSKRWCWLPLTLIWLTSPFDAAIDTICIPWDW